jgi:hypothetical protein
MALGTRIIVRRRKKKKAMGFLRRDFLLASLVRRSLLVVGYPKNSEGGVGDRGEDGMINSPLV